VDSRTGQPEFAQDKERGLAQEQRRLLQELQQKLRRQQQQQGMASAPPHATQSECYWDPSTRTLKQVRSLHDSTFSRTVWRLYGGSKGPVMWYYRADALPRVAAHPPTAAELQQRLLGRSGSAAAAVAASVEVCHYITQPLVELYGGCMVVLKVSWCGITARRRGRWSGQCRR
jgi:hypothetical protein